MIEASPPPRDVPVVRLARTPRGARAVGFVIGALMMSLVLALVFVPWQQNVAGQGRVIAYAPTERQQTIAAPISGRVTEVLVTEGSAVKAGDVLLNMSDVDPLFAQRLEQDRALVVMRQTAAEARVSAIEGRLGAIEDSRQNGLDAARARVDMAKERARAAEQALVAAAAARELAALNLPRTEALAKDGIKSTRDLELARAEAQRTAADEERAKATLDAAQSEVRSLEADRSRFERDATASLQDVRGQLEAARAELANAQAEVLRADTRVARQSSQAVVAPKDGVVMRVLVPPGGPVISQGAPLITLVPNAAARAVEVWMDGNDAPLIEQGRKVRLQFEGWPAVQFIGWPSVAVGTFGGVVSLVDATDDGAGRFRIVVLPDPDDQYEWPSNRYLRQGVRTNAWVLLRQVPLGYELWRQLNGFPPVVSLTAPPTEKGKGTEAKSP